MTASGATVRDGYYNVQFKLYSASSGGTAQWTETYYDSNGVTAGNDNRVRVVNGYLSVYLGSQTTFPGTINLGPRTMAYPKHWWHYPHSYSHLRRRDEPKNKAI